VGTGRADRRRTHADTALDPRAFADVFDSLPHGVVVVDERGAVVARNTAAQELFGPLHDRAQLRCCDLLRCGGDNWPLASGCLTAAVLERGRPLAAFDISLETRRVEVTIAPLRAGRGAVLHLRAEPAAAAGPAAPPPLRITTLGSLRLECGGEDLGGEWLDHRPGRLLSYLICARGRRVPVEELVDMLWPGSRSQGLTSLRQCVHALRDRLEPDRQKQAPSRFILARPNAYELSTESIVVDADEFEREAAAALRVANGWGGTEAQAHLAHAAQLYRDEFLPAERYAEWTFNERGRLADLAADVLRALAKSHLEAGEAPSATSALQRLADLEPFDLDAQRDLIALMIRERRHGEAARRYEQVRRQFTRAFGHEPDFALSDLVQRGADAA
jgi:DNA-binding SARP family transcriptional activator